MQLYQSLNSESYPHGEKNFKPKSTRMSFFVAKRKKVNTSYAAHILCKAISEQNKQCKATLNWCKNLAHFVVMHDEAFKVSVNNIAF